MGRDLLLIVVAMMKKRPTTTTTHQSGTLKGIINQIRKRLELVPNYQKIIINLPKSDKLSMFNLLVQQSVRCWVAEEDKIK